MVKRREPMPLGSLHVTPTEFHIADPTTWGSSIEQVAMRDWLEFHGIDSNDVPLESPIHRDLVLHRVVYLRIVRNAEGKIMVDPLDPRQVLVVSDSEENEAGPLPWPEEVLRHLREDDDATSPTDSQEVDRDISRWIAEANRSPSTIERPGDTDFRDILD